MTLRSCAAADATTVGPDPIALCHTSGSELSTVEPERQALLNKKFAAAGILLDMGIEIQSRDLAGRISGLSEIQAACLGFWRLLDGTL